MTMTGFPHTDQESHGTRCAGQIIAKPNNGVCGVGVAYNANLACIRQ